MGCDDSQKLLELGANLVVVPWMFLRRFSTSFVAAALLCATAMGIDTSRPVSDEALRLVALRAIFPGMQISGDPSKGIDDSWPEKPRLGELVFPDALAGERVYRVIGEAMNTAESWASSDVITGRFSKTRQVRFRLFRWPNESDTGLLAVLQYNFPGASPAMSCPSIGLLVHIVRIGANWTVKEKYLLETVHHQSLQGIRLMDLRGEGAHELVVESNSGGAGSVESSLQVFDLSQGRLEEVLNTESRLQNMTDDWYTQTLDLSRTRESNGQRLCFSKTTFFEEGQAFRPPRVTRPCYKPGDGVHSEEVRNRNKLLATPR